LHADIQHLYQLQFLNQQLINQIMLWVIPIGWLVGWLVGQSVGWLVNPLVGWSILWLVKEDKGARG